MPERVPDLAALAANLEEYMDQWALAPRTAATHQRNWAWWQRYCLRVAIRRGTTIDPLDAPFSVFVELWTEFAEDGRPFSVAYVDKFVAAVLERYGRLGLVPAHKRPENRSAWTTLRKGAQHQEADRRAAGKLRQRGVTPLSREVATLILTAEPPRTEQLDSRRAAVLLAIDTQLPNAKLFALASTDVELLPDGGIRVAGTALPCDHRERVRGVPWDCTACAVRALLGRGTLRLLAAVAVDTTYWLRQQRMSWPGFHRQKHGPIRLTGRSGLSQWELAGLRRGATLAVGVEAGVWAARARAWTAVSWTAGFRMCSDLDRLARDRVYPDAAGRGIWVELAGTREDRTGSKHVKRMFTWNVTGGPSVAGFLTEWLCVRDAALGSRSGYLLPAIHKERVQSAAIVGVQGQAKRDMSLLCRFAGLPEDVLSAYSTRKGYALQAQLDGWSEEMIQAGMRHVELDTTLRHYLPANEKSAVTHLMDQL